MLPFLLLPSSWWIPDKEQPLLPHGSLLNIKGSKALISFMIIAVGNKQTKEKEKLIQKYLALLRCGKYNLQTFHKQENRGQEDGNTRGEQSLTVQPAAMEGCCKALKRNLAGGSNALL